MNGLQALIIASTTFASLTASAGVLNRLSGTWDTMPIDKPTCESDEYQHTMVVSPHKDRVTIKHAKAIDGPNGKIQEYTYKVLYEQEDRVMLFLEGETRKTRNGDLVIWELILERPDYYRWRTYGSPADWRNSVVGQRCKT
ncbi:hypothetical protein [Variovorax paradoxus]|uniref:hypothetical protein n=1 Tax=Variovorax paradoxus TaxID=34073 RepID=UPI0029C972C0|nr:hypothetical protein RZE77_28830 [Variovorax paradoxus]